MSDHFWNLIVYCYFYAKYKFIVSSPSKFMALGAIFPLPLLSINLSYIKLPAKIIIDTINAI